MHKFNRSMVLGLLAVGLALVLSGCYANSLRSLGTPMPTLIPATPPQFVSLPVQADLAAAVSAPAGTPQGTPAAPQEKTPCRVRAGELLGAWVAAQAPESDSFPFTDAAGETCQGTFSDDIQPLFTKSNTWYAGAPPCITCHYGDLKNAWAQLDLSSYAGILAGSRRASPEAKGNNILGMSDAGVDWGKAILYTQITTHRMPPGRPANDDPNGPLVTAGSK